MLIYMTSYKHEDDIKNIIEECNQKVLAAIADIKVSLSLFIKQQLDHFKNVDLFIIDLSCLIDSDEEIKIALSNFRMLYDKAKIIIIALERKAGDVLLSEIFCLGIYNIITQSTTDSLIQELLFCVNQGKSYKDGLIFKIDAIEDMKNSKQQKVKEKIIIKNEIRQTISVNKAFVGFAGAQSRIGVTHNAIVSANFLNSKGYKVALVENSLNEAKSFDSIRESFDLEEEQKDYFVLNKIHYYPDFDFTNLNQIIVKNYNFIVIDFGLFMNLDMLEFNRCIEQIVVCGSKAWEIPAMNQIFSIQTEEVLKEYKYIFNFTDESNAKELKKNMGALEKVYFMDYTPDPFNSNFCTEIPLMFKDYIPEQYSESERKKKSSLLERFIKK